jgi:alpha-1,6-mannosyltransferase
MHLVDTTMFFAREGGGVQRYLLTKHDWLSRHTRVQHTILAPGDADTVDATGVITMKSSPLFFSNGYHFPLNPRRWCRRLLALAPDLIEVGDPYGPAWAALNAGQQLGVPVIAFYHSDLIRLVGIRFGTTAERVSARYVRELYAGFDAVLAPSRFISRKLRTVGVERVVRQPLGVDTRLFHPDRRDPDFRRKLGLAKNTRLLVFAGRFAREKNLPLLLSTLRLLGPHYHLLLIGSGSSVVPQSNVTVLPYQTSSEALARLIASCDALVHAGQQETFGLVVLEAMACGLPVVAVGEGGVAELVDERCGILVPPGKSAALAEGVAALYDMDVQQLGARARGIVEAAYGWDHVLHSLLRFYRQRLNATSPLAAREAYVCR